MADHERFWSTIEDCRRKTSDLDELAADLVETLKTRTVEEILEFRAVFDECLNRAYRWDLWGAAYVINGGCSDDGFDYFIGWLIAQGKDYYEAALADPERAGDAVEPGDEADFEGMWYVAGQAYEAVTGLDDFYDRLPSSRRCEIQGDEWDEDDLPSLFPSLSKRFD